MKNLLIGIFLGLIVGVTTCCSSTSVYRPPVSGNSLQGVIDTACLSTVKLQVADAGKNKAIVASGFAIDNETILTAGHFCMSAYMGNIMGVLSNDVEVVSVNRNNELAVLKGGKIDAINEKMDLCTIKRPKHGVVPFKFATEELKIHEKIVVIGGPMGFFPVTTSGRVISPSTTDFPAVELNNRLSLSVSGTHGNSGGPVLNSKGEVVGLVMAKMATYDRIMIAVKLDTIKQFLVEEYGE